MENSCFHDLWDMGSFHPSYKILLDIGGYVYGNIVEDHNERSGFYLLLWLTKMRL